MSNTALVGYAGVVSVNSQNIAEIRSFSIDLTADTIETTTMGGTNSGRTYTKGLSSFTGSADVYFDPEHFSTADLDGLINADVGDASVQMTIYPEGDGSGNQSMSGNIHVTGYSISASFDGLVEASISFQGDGQLTYTEAT